MPKVFILNRGSHDYTKAERFGELCYISDGMLPKLQTGTMYRTLKDAFVESSSDDFIVLSSLSTLCSIAVAMFAVQHGVVNLLIFNDNDYILRRIQF